MERAASRLVERHGAAHEERIRAGVAQVAARWWSEDGDESGFEAFCAEGFLPDEGERARAFQRLEERLEQIEGRLH